MPLAALPSFFSLYGITFEDSSVLGRDDALLSYRFLTFRRDVVPLFSVIHRSERSSETSATKNQTPGNHPPKKNSLQLIHGENLKTRTERIFVTCIPFNSTTARFIQTPGTECPVRRRHLAEEQSPQPPAVLNLKTHILTFQILQYIQSRTLHWLYLFV